MKKHKKWKLDDYCPKACSGVPDRKDRWLCIVRRLKEAARSIGLGVEHDVITNLYRIAGGKPVILYTGRKHYDTSGPITKQLKYPSVMAEQWIPRWVFVVATHKNTAANGALKSPLPGQWYAGKIPFSDPGDSVVLWPNEDDYLDVMEELKACVRDVEHRLAFLALLGHHANVTVRHTAQYILENGFYEDKVMPNIPRLRKGWMCLRDPTNVDVMVGSPPIWRF